MAFFSRLAQLSMNFSLLINLNGAKSFLLEKAPFHKGGKTILTEVPPLEVNPFRVDPFP